MKKTLVIVAGPTASGKTGLAIQLALHFKTVIVSADSRQFYKELNIGTAKPSGDELNTVHHYFINSHSVTEPFNAGDFAIHASDEINKLFATHNVLIMVGGSGLYIDAAINGIDDLPAASPEIRKSLGELFENGGIESLQKMLKEKDPISFSKIDIHNPRRVTRALEVTLSTGQPYSSLLKKSTAKNNWNIVLTGINWPRKELYDRINQRVEKMIVEGLKDEAKLMYSHKNLNALKTVGYKEMFSHLDGELTLEETIALIAKNTRNYAKRQMTWFRKYPNMKWIKPGEESELIQFIENEIRE